MSEPRGAVGDAPRTLAGSTSRADVDPGSREPADVAAEAGAPADAADLVADDADAPLDASAHAHLLEEPLPPGTATEKAVIYDVTLAGPAAGDVVDRRAGAEHADEDHDEERDGEQGEERDGDQDDADGPADGAAAGDRGTPTHARRRPAASVPAARRVGAAGAVVLVAALACLSGYLWISASEWRDQAGYYQATATDLGDDLASARNQLAGTQAELEAVRAQLSTAHQRIVELADEKNQALDDWELTQQLVDYQQRISEAAGGVALALDRCVQGQQELIGFLEQQLQTTPSPPPYDPTMIAEFETQVEALCQEASEANIGLQLELAR